MYKPLFLTLAVCILFSGCGIAANIRARNDAEIQKPSIRSVLNNTPMIYQNVMLLKKHTKPIWNIGVGDILVLLQLRINRKIRD